MDKIKTTDKITEDMIVVVSLVENFDMASNFMWDNDANKSYPRDGKVCFCCKKPVVMSNFAFEQNPKDDKIMCIECVLKEIKV